MVRLISDYFVNQMFGVFDVPEIIASRDAEGIRFTLEHRVHIDNGFPDCSVREGDCMSNNKTAAVHCICFVRTEWEIEEPRAFGLNLC